MHGLTEFHHQIVGQVGKQINGAAAAIEETDAHIQRALMLVDILKTQTGVAVAQRVFDL